MFIENLLIKLVYMYLRAVKLHYDYILNKITNKPSVKLDVKTVDKMRRDNNEAYSQQIQDIYLGECAYLTNVVLKESLITDIELVEINKKYN
jgi:hypothetical protein